MTDEQQKLILAELDVIVDRARKKLYAALHDEYERHQAICATLEDDFRVAKPLPRGHARITRFDAWIVALTTGLGGGRL